LQKIIEIVQGCRLNKTILIYIIKKTFPHIMVKDIKEFFKIGVTKDQKISKEETDLEKDMDIEGLNESAKRSLMHMGVDSAIVPEV